MSTVNPLNQLEHNELIRGVDKDKYLKGTSNELGRLLQCFNQTKENNALFFISKEKKIPKENIPIYVQISCELRPHKSGTQRIPLMAGGTLISYPREKSTLVASIETIKLH